MGGFSSFWKHFKVLGVFILLEVIAIVLLLRFNAYQHSVLFNVANSIRTNVFSSMNIITQHIVLEKQNNDLMVENALLMERVKKLQQNKLIEIPERLQRYDCIPAKIIQSSIGLPDNYLIINKGEVDGVETEMPVMASEGVVGIVYAVSQNYATILPVINTSFSCLASVGGYTLSSNTSWDGKDYHYISVENMPLHIKIEKGDTVFTNNNSMLYPNKEVIGVVDAVKTVDLGKYNQLKVRLEVDFAKLQHVYILKDNHKVQVDSLSSDE